MLITTSEIIELAKTALGYPTVNIYTKDILPLLKLCMLQVNKYTGMLEYNTYSLANNKVVGLPDNVSAVISVYPTQTVYSSYKYAKVMTINGTVTNSVNNPISPQGSVFDFAEFSNMTSMIRLKGYQFAWKKIGKDIYVDDSYTDKVTVFMVRKFTENYIDDSSSAYTTLVELLIARLKQTEGLLRRRFSVTDMENDGSELAQEGKEEEEKILTDLKESQNLAVLMVRVG